jgi:hypothetical protein
LFPAFLLDYKTLSKVSANSLLSATYKLLSNVQRTKVESKSQLTAYNCSLLHPVKDFSEVLKFVLKESVHLSILLNGSGLLFLFIFRIYTEKPD